MLNCVYLIIVVRQVIIPVYIPSSAYQLYLYCSSWNGQPVRTQL